MTIGGSCRCGAVHYTLAVEKRPPVYCCHCTDCQTWSGSAFSEQAVVRADAITATGLVVAFDILNASGAISTQHVCNVCHTRLWNTNSVRPGLAVVRAGTLDYSNELSPLLHMWVRSKQPWVQLPGEIPTFEKSAPPERFMAILFG